MEKKKLIKVIKATVCKQAVLPILENVLIGDGYLSVTDLETVVSIPYGGPEACLPADKFITALEMFEQPVITNEFKVIETPADENNKAKRLYKSSIFIKEFKTGNKREIKLTGEDPMNFPKDISSVEANFNHIGYFSQAALDCMETALRFVSNDDLRPAMTGVYLGNDIAATDAHRLYWQPITPLLESLIIPAKTVKILLAIGGLWDLYFNGVNDENGCNGSGRAILRNEDGVCVIFRTIDARFPQYRVVIPTGKGNATLSCDVTILRSEIKNALKFSNSSTNQITFTLNGTTTINSGDVDFEMEYKNELPAKVVKTVDELKIAFNGKFLDQILGELDKGETPKIKLWGPTKAAIINNRFLITPLMLNSGTD